MSINQFLLENDKNVLKNIFPINTALPSIEQEEPTILDICNVSSVEEITNPSKNHNECQPYSFPKKNFKDSVNINRSDIYEFNSSNEQDVKDFSNGFGSTNKKTKTLKKDNKTMDCRNFYKTCKDELFDLKKRKIQLDNVVSRSANYSEVLNLKNGFESKEHEFEKINQVKIKKVDYSTDEDYAKIVKEKLESSIKRRLRKRKFLNQIDKNTECYTNKQKVLDNYKKSYDKEMQTSETEEFSSIFDNFYFKFQICLVIFIQLLTFI